MRGLAENFRDSGEQWFLVEPSLERPRLVRTVGDTVVREGDSDALWSGTDDEEDARMRQQWSRVVDWAARRGVDGIQASAPEEEHQETLASFGFSIADRPRRIDPRRTRRTGPWCYEGAAAPKILRDLIEIPLISLVAYNDDIDLVWVIDDSWYATLVNEPRGLDALAEYGL